jgi:hypothetical protein
MCLKHYNQWYRKKHSEEIKAQKKIYHKKNKKYHNEYSRKYHIRRKKENPEKIKEEKQRSRIKLRREILLAYSQGRGKCACCGNDCKKGAWDLDHLDDTGSNVRKLELLGTPYYFRTRKNGFPNKENIVVKCCNCNQARKYGGHKKSDHKLKIYPIDRHHRGLFTRKSQEREHRYKLECMMAYCNTTGKKFRKLFKELRRTKNHHSFDAWLNTKPGLAVADALLKGRLRCETCKETWFDFLTLNHTEGGGGKRRTSGQEPQGKTIYGWLRKLNFPTIPGRNVLCYNCQRIDKNKRSRSSD